MTVQRTNKLKTQFQDLKRIKVCGMKFTIRRLNPLLDFSADKMPQIFTDFLTRRKADPAYTPSVIELQKMQTDAYAVVQAGVVEPDIVPVGIGDKRGREDGITVEDLFRDSEMGFKLYNEIIEHSLFRFKGIKGLFFSIKIKYLAYMQQRKNMALLRLTCFFLIAITQILNRNVSTFLS